MVCSVCQVKLKANSIADFESSLFVYKFYFFVLSNHAKIKNWHFNYYKGKILTVFESTNKNLYRGDFNGLEKGCKPADGFAIQGTRSIFDLYPASHWRDGDGYFHYYTYSCYVCGGKRLENRRCHW